MIAVILAAGRSARMGCPKALLPHRDGRTTFVRHLIEQAHSAGLETALVVGRAGDEALRREVAAANGLFVPNLDADRGQLSSLLSALDALPAGKSVEGLLVMPVDVPLVTRDAIHALIHRHATTGGVILRATHRGAHGHPVLFTRATFGELRRADPALGARAVVRADPARVIDVEVNDPGVIADVDTPDDYQRLFGHPLRETGLPR